MKSWQRKPLVPMKAPTIKVDIDDIWDWHISMTLPYASKPKYYTAIVTSVDRFSGEVTLTPNATSALLALLWNLDVKYRPGSYGQP